MLKLDSQSFPKGFTQLVMGIKMPLMDVHLIFKTQLSSNRYKLGKEIGGYPHPGLKFLLLLQIAHKIVVD